MYCDKWHLQERILVERGDLIELLAETKMFREWHWFRYHFSHSIRGQPNALADSVLDACLMCEKEMPGFAEEFVARIGSVGGREKHLPDWEQLLQQLSELHIVAQTIRWPWPSGTSFEHEPTGRSSPKRPELCVTAPGLELGIEVKTPAIFEHWARRSNAPLQFPSRSMPRNLVESVAGESSATLPRDNPVKDFLASAEEKFAPFVSENPDFIGLLFICWDDYLYEPISSLSHERCGLLTENSFHRGKDGSAVTFPSVAGVIVLRHLYQLIRACREEPLMDGIEHPLDYGSHGRFPWKAFFQNPHGNAVPTHILRCFDARVPTRHMGAEYQALDFIAWYVS